MKKLLFSFKLDINLKKNINIMNKRNFRRSMPKISFFRLENQKITN